MRRILFPCLGVLLLGVAAVYWALYKLTPGWIDPVCSNCSSGVVGRARYRYGYLRSHVPTKLSVYEDKWFKFTVFSAMTVDIDETDNRIDISGYLLSDGSFSASRLPSTSGLSELSIYGSNDSAPGASLEFQRDAKGQYSLPGYPAVSGEIIPQSINTIKLKDGSIAAIFATKQRIPYANIPGPLNELHAYYAPGKGHLLHFQANLGCSPSHAKRQIALLNLVLESFEIKNQWKWVSSNAGFGARTAAERSNDRFDKLQKRVQRMQQREAGRKNPI